MTDIEILLISILFLVPLSFASGFCFGNLFGYIKGKHDARNTIRH